MEIALLPSISMLEIDGRSTTVTTSTLPSRYELDVLEETGLEQGAGGLDQGLVVDGLADVQRQGGEHATGGHALQAIDPDIGNSEGLGVNLGDHQR